jgi:hypothetical protein
MLRKNSNSPQKPLDFGVFGKIKTGAKHPTKGYPVSLDYFLFAPMQEGGTKNRYIEIAETLFPNSKEAPRNRLPITFSSDSEDNIFNALELRDHQGKLIAHTDRKTISVSVTEAWEKWYKANHDKVKTPQPTPKSWLIFDVENEFGEDSIFGDFETFIGGLQDKAQKAAAGSKSLPEWVEVLRLRFVLVNFPVQCRWELRTKGTATSIGNIIDSYLAVKDRLGTVVGVQWELSIEKVKSNRAGIARQYPVLKIAPVITENTLKNSQLVIDSVNVHQEGLKLQSGENYNPEPQSPMEFEDLDYQDV